MIESIACGTPVVAFRGGSVAEIVDPDVTGFIVENVEEAIAAVKRIPSIDRQACRQRFLERFTARRMCEAYLGRVRAWHLGKETRSTRETQEQLSPFSPGVFYR